MIHDLRNIFGIRGMFMRYNRKYHVFGCYNISIFVRGPLFKCPVKCFIEL